MQIVTSFIICQHNIIANEPILDIIGWQTISESNQTRLTINVLFFVGEFVINNILYIGK